MATRDELKNKFKSGKCPSQDDYHAIFDSTIGYNEDKVVKPFEDNPLKIQGRGTEENILKFTSRNTSQKEWLIQLNKKNKPGLSISSDDSPYLFLKEGGKVGIGTNDPKTELHVKGNIRLNTSQHTAGIFGGIDDNGNHNGLHIQADPNSFSGAYIILRPSTYKGQNAAGSMYLTFGDYNAPAPENARLYFRHATKESGSSKVKPIMILDSRKLEVYGDIQFNEKMFWTFNKQVIAEQGSHHDFFGVSVAISGNWAVVGASGENKGGRAYLFQKDEGGTNNWGQVGEPLEPENDLNGCNFGYAVALSGNWAVVGASGENKGGRAYLFQTETDENGVNKWEQVGDPLQPDDIGPEDFFGISVAISGNWVIVGASGKEKNDNNQSKGAVYCFDIKNLENPIQLNGMDYGDAFGHSVAISGDWAIVGAFTRDIGGAAFLFNKNKGGNKNWGQVGQQLVPNDIHSGDCFGRSVAISGNWVIIGSPYKDARRGAAYIFRTSDEGGNFTWEQRKKLILEKDLLGDNDEFGHRVAIFEGCAFVSAWHKFEEKGSVYVFKNNAKDEEGNFNWGQTTKLMAFDKIEDDKFGSSIAISENLAIIGAQTKMFDDKQKGAAYIFENTGSIKTILEELITAL